MNRRPTLRRLGLGTLLLCVPPVLAALAGCRADVAETPCCRPGGDAPAASAPRPLPDSSVYLLEHEWQDQAGAVRRLSAFQGRPVLLAMIFTHCRYSCPAIVGDVKGLLARLPAGVTAPQVVLASMDVARDTPERLAEFAREHGLGADRFTLLHGSEDAVAELAAVLGMRIAKVDGGDFSHSSRITLLDNDGRIAAQLDGLGAEPAPVVAALQRLAAR